jgi:hypothetical protein
MQGRGRMIVRTNMSARMIDKGELLSQVRDFLCLDDFLTSDS